MEKGQIENRFDSLCGLLKDEMNPEGFWTGRLSSSALSTAVSIVTLKLSGKSELAKKIEEGLNWLFNTINKDGGFGDTPESKSNVSTTLLCYAAIISCGQGKHEGINTMSRMESYLKNMGIVLQSDKIAKSVLDFYGKDLTFSVPILSMLSICGVINKEGLKKIPQLPFEFSLFPNSLYQFFNLQVVSYAIPALIAVGIYLFKEKRSKNPVTRFVRKKSIRPALKKLESIMPESGGFLEAAPLTAFTSMCLICSGFANHIVVEKVLLFLDKQQRTDGSWPIDTDLSTWVTTLSVKALGHKLNEVLSPEQVKGLRRHLLDLQYKNRHPFNMAEPGGWGWTSYSGSVPDADDTPGAILALLEMYEGSMEETVAILQGCKWLLGMQNRDGGIPTFCKGWGRLPFDRSCADLTGHSIQAWLKTLDKLGDKVPLAIRSLIKKGIEKALSYLVKHQEEDGSWLPLWFGSQLTVNNQNPIYGTCKVGLYLLNCRELDKTDSKLKEKLDGMLLKSRSYIINQQNQDGSWGAIRGVNGTIEETSLSIGFLADVDVDVCTKGIGWIERTIGEKGLFSSPIGLYFASLWYDEKMYPIIYYLEALGRFINKRDTV
jgi:hypothetical protein